MTAQEQASHQEILPPGLIFLPDFLSPVEEKALLSFLGTLEFRTFQMQGVTAKRRIRQFGWHYAFESYQLTPTDPIPAEFAGIQARSAARPDLDPTAWAEDLVTEYAPGAGIGWHRDAPAFGVVAGISLAGRYRMRFQTANGAARMTSAVELPPRSIEMAAHDPPTRERRYSITFRTLREQRTRRSAARGLEARRHRCVRDPGGSHIGQ